MGANVLVVEDQRIVAMQIRFDLQSFGCQVLDVVHSGEDAIRVIKERTADLVLMDIHLEGRLTGIEAAREILSFARIPIVYLTAYADTATRTEAQSTNPAGFIEKPYDPRLFRKTVEAVLASR